MIDLNFIKNNPAEAQNLFKKRKCNVNVEEFLGINSELNSKKMEFDSLRAEQKRTGNRERALELKNKIVKLKEEVDVLEDKRNKIWLSLPNVLAADTPEGASDADNQEIKRCGNIRKFDFKPESHEIIGERLGIFDLARGAKVSGNGFYYLVGLGADLAFAVYGLARDLLRSKGFEFLIPPVLASHRTFMGTGYFPFEPEQNYKIENENLYPIGTSEQTILAFHDNEILDEKKLPLLYSAVTPCFRTESGSYGKHSKGGFRVHQFHKMEQIIFCHPEESEKWHKKCLENIEELMQMLEIPYRIVRVCIGDMGAPGYKKYDVEGWFPSFESYRETHSNTNLTDFQTRRLNIRINSNGKKFFPHTVSSTEITDRAIFAILENNQQEDGSVIIPKKLQKYIFDAKIIRKRV
ncbi:MAG: serine--tRNA ligase [Candidatus Improbicoccus pseudotrichonymphae]|uniref:Serine--tRNA ligase n=1 Tax=Candidatus Improbicoccus pseudotrichonymphae TaxID=3033792 RepID=A0AA48HUP9_9FIRM|nr:MAG: serine--tRNA ligase [Candidatus Improbicoccus pseudotrichonymphae]